MGKTTSQLSRGTFTKKQNLLKFAKDEVAAQAIKDTDFPCTARSIGKAIYARGWEGIELTDLKTHMREKFQQNPEFMQPLMETGTKKLLELTLDKKWAAGYGPYSNRFENQEQPGQNLTGYALEELRTEFRGLAPALMLKQSTPLPQRAGMHKRDRVETAEAARPALEQVQNTPGSAGGSRTNRIISTSQITNVSAYRKEAR